MLPAGRWPWTQGARAPASRLASLRQTAYKMFGQSMLPPDQGRAATLAGVARDLLGSRDAWGELAFSREWERFLRAMEGLPRQDGIRLQNQYVFLFLANQRGVPCPIFESAYCEDPSVKVALLASLERAYGQMGVRPNHGLAQSPDHGALELEFASILCGREADAWRQRDLGGALELLRRERRFVKTHLRSWLPLFASRLARLGVIGPFPTTSKALAAFVNHDGDLLDILIDHFTPARVGKSRRSPKQGDLL